MYSIDIRIKWLWFDLSSGDNYPTVGCHFVLFQHHTTACFASLPPSLPTWWIIGWWRLIFLFEGRNRTNAYAVVPALTLPLRLSPIAMVVTRIKVSLTVLCQVICNCNLVVRWQECLTLIVSSSDKSYRESSLSLVAVEFIKSNPESRSICPTLFVI